MARTPFRAHGPTEPKPVGTTASVVLLSTALTACVSYEPAPVDPAELLAGLDAVRFESPEHAETIAEDEVGPRQLAAFAVAHNPTLATARSRIGIARSLLVEAGLLADPEIGWDGMDALASQIVEHSVSSVDVLSGFGLSIPLPRPGELGAKKAAARWRVEELRRRLLEAEWRLAGEVYVAWEDLVEAEQLLEQNRELADVARTTEEYFQRAREVGAATAIQSNLATGDALAIGARQVRLEARLRRSRHALNALLGLPPSTVLPVSHAGSPASDPGFDEEASPEALVELALARRPDLAALLAAHRAADEEVRLEVRRQFPLIAIGTGISLTPGLFTRFNRPAIRTAIARRSMSARLVTESVHGLRREVSDALASYREAERELEFLETALLPNAESSLDLARQSFDAGEVTLLEILTLQRALVDARTRTTEARAELRRRRWRLLVATGALLLPTSAPQADSTDSTTP